MAGNVRQDRPVTGEAPFALHEIFFSRTDERGVILSGNDVFQRVAAYDWERLLGAPHRLIRHPDMPKAVFWLLWDTIKQGKPIGAYVKNKAADGLHYWVFAIVTPVEGGYLSVRIKPSSPLFGVVEKEYAALLKLETERKLAPADSAALLLARLKELGFADYDAFLAHVIAAEMEARDRGLGRRPDSRFAAVADIAAKLDRMQAELAGLFANFEAIRGIPSNMRIVASRLEPAGGPISAISENYKVMSNDITGHLRAFSGGTNSRYADMTRLVREGLVLLAIARVQAEVIAHCSEASDDCVRPDRASEMALLHRQEETYRDQTLHGMRRIAEDATRLARTCTDLRRLVVGLDSVRVMCRVESGRLRGKVDGLSAIIDQLDKFHGETDKRLAEITELSDKIAQGAQALLPRRSVAA
jgi:aerotaxis receptor